MNFVKQSLIPMSTNSVKLKDRKTRPQSSKNEKDNQLKPLLSTTSFADEQRNQFELGTIDSDEEDKIDCQQDKPTRTIIRSRQKKVHSAPAAQSGGSIVIIEKPVHPNETLQAFAIRYRVPVAQLKRLNNLQNDQDFYALKYCRVPIRRFGLLYETPSPTILNFDEQSATISLPGTHFTQHNHHAFLNAMDQDLQKMRTKVEQLIEHQPTTLIPQPIESRAIVRSSTKTKTDLNFDGADCGCKLWHIILFILLVALFIPFVYVYLYLFSPEEVMDHHQQ